MVAGKDISFPAEMNSLVAAGALVESVWDVAKELKIKAFRREPGPDIQDDHLALNRAGIPAIDIIDFDYPYWHKADDLPENCAAESLAEVGRVITAWLALPRQRSRR